MGCGASKNEGGGEAQKTKETKYDDQANNLYVLPGRQKYFGDPGAIVSRKGEKPTDPVIACGSRKDVAGLFFSVRVPSTGKAFYKQFSDDELDKAKIDQKVPTAVTWPVFHKSIASDLLKNKTAGSDTGSGFKLEFKIPLKDGTEAPFAVQCDTPIENQSDMHKFVLLPLTDCCNKRRVGEDKEKELKIAKFECGLLVTELTSKAAHALKESVTERVTPILYPLREEAAAVSKKATEAEFKVGSLERRLKRLKNAGTGKTALDGVLEDGGARPYQHLPDADEYVPPTDKVYSEHNLNIVQAAFPLPEGTEVTALSNPRAISNPQLQALFESAPSEVAEETLKTMVKLDQWDYNVFDMEKHTDQGALFFTSYALLYKNDLVRHFNMDDKIVRNFLRAVQLGYHPNPYHNATHAADVCHICTYITTQGGLSEVCKLTKSDILAAILASAIHDYDHPGYNNNFHTRTGAYLSTLYNDRSILENHHCACIFEMTRLPQYNIFASLDAEQQRDVRDTIIEMVLSTDMGNHAKIFSQFRNRISEGSEWAERREDVRLALSMSIKMADISNCGRPNHLYMEWAKNIATEFYQQGDSEAKHKLVISPFMDRAKDKTDFPKGQVSFMNYIVVPMFEAIAEMLPKMEFVLQHCQENKDYWQSQ